MQNGVTAISMVLVRHGYSKANAAKVYSGLSDVDLTEQGKRDLREFRARGIYPATQRHFSSPLRRCLQTFEVLYGPQTRLDGVIDAFHEVDLGLLEGRGLPLQEAKRLWGSWVSQGSFAADFAMETFAHARDRGAGAVRNLALSCASAGVSTVTVVTHSAIMRAALMGLAALPQESWGGLWAPNGLGYRVLMQVDGAIHASPDELDEKPAVRFLRAEPLVANAVPGGIPAVLPGRIGSVE